MFFEVEPDHWINLDQTWRAVLNGNSVDYYSAALAAKESVNYGSNQAAEDALAAFVAAGNPPPNIVGVGDRLHLIVPNQLERQWGDTIDVTILQVKTSARPYWIFAIDGSDVRLLWELPVTWERRDPLDP